MEYASGKNYYKLWDEINGGITVLSLIIDDLYG
jgi:hypothetical protein